MYWHVVLLLSSFIYSAKTAAFPFQKNVNRPSLVTSKFRIENRINIENMQRLLRTNDNGVLDGYNGNGSGWRGGGDGGGGGGGNRDNHGDESFNGGDKSSILALLPFVLSEKLKQDAKHRVVSTLSSLSYSRLISLSAAYPLASTKKLAINQSASSIRYFQCIARTSLTNTKSRSSDLFQWYISKLDRNPLLVKSISSGLVAFCADFAAQVFEQSKCVPQARQEKQYDRRRLTACLAEGLFISGPLMHFGYNYLENLIPIQNGPGNNKNIAAIIHVLADSIILDSIFVGSKILTTGLLEGHSFKEDILSQFQKDYLGTMKTSWLLSTGLLPLEFACFRLLPTSLRALSMDITSIVWDGVISYKAHQSRHLYI